MPKRLAPKTKAKKTRRKTAAKRTPPKPPTVQKPPLAISSQHVDYVTYKASQLQRFYGEVLELPAEFREVDGLDYLVVRTSGSSSLGFMPPHPDMRGGEATPREPGLYFMVEDVDRAYAHLVAKGVRFARPPQTMPWGHRVLTTTDPEGRTVMIAGEVEPED